MNLPLIYAVGACVAAASAEALFMGKGGHAFMKSFRLPAFAPPAWGWALLGAGYYIICFIAMYRLTSRTTPSRLATDLLMIVMAANAFWNFVYFRLRDLRLTFWYSVGYACLVAVLLVALLRTDNIAAIVFAIYAAYLPYALALFYRIWKLNR